MTLPTQLVLSALLEDPARELYGLQICAAAGLPSGTIHPILARLEKVGWLSSRWEQVDPRTTGRPRRRYYRLNSSSIALVKAALARTQSSAVRSGKLRHGLTGGAR